MRTAPAAFFITLSLVGGFALGRHFAAPRNFTALSDADLEEYYRLQGLKERYEKADELLGKAVLALIADFGFRLSESNLQAVQNSAAGNRRPVVDPVAFPSAKPSPRAERMPVASSSPISGSPASGPSPTPSPHPSLISLGGSWGSVPIRPGWHSCDPSPVGWTVLGENPYDYRVTRDSSDPLAVMIQSLHDRVRPESIVLDDCLPPPSATDHRITLIIPVRAQNVRDYANVHIRAENEHKEVIGYAKTSVHGSFYWKELVVELEIPQGTTRLSYGVLLESTGTLWVRPGRTEMH